MNPAPMIPITKQDIKVGVSTARLLLTHALEQEEQNADGDNPDVARKRAINAHTGASALLPPKANPEEKPNSETKPPLADKTSGS